jgi:uncharacterized repeat protein (TIGR01451 family)
VVTSGTDGFTDSPDGATSSTATFDVTTTPGGCPLTVVKTANHSAVVPGEKVVYTLIVTDTGSLPFPATNPAEVTDSLAGVLTESSYDNDAAATSGAVSYSAPVLGWRGPLTVGQTATITYSVTVDQTPTLPFSMTNTVIATVPGSNCDAGSEASTCTVSSELAAITIQKATTTTLVTHIGQQVAYTFTVTNTGEVALSQVAVVDHAGASVSGSTLAAPTCPQTTLQPGASEVCTSTYTATTGTFSSTQVVDTAVATGTAPAPDQPNQPVTITSAPSTVRVPVVLRPSTADGSGTHVATSSDNSASIRITSGGGLGGRSGGSLRLVGACLLLAGAFLALLAWATRRRHASS